MSVNADVVREAERVIQEYQAFENERAFWRP